MKTPYPIAVGQDTLQCMPRSHLPSRFKRPTVWPKRQRRRDGSWGNNRRPDEAHYPSCSTEQANDEACGDARRCHRVQLLCIEWPAQDANQAQKLAELAARLLRCRRCTAVQPWLRWRALLGRAVDALRDASPMQPNPSRRKCCSTSKTKEYGRSESRGEVVQVCLSAGREAAFFRRLPWDMPISGVKRLLLAVWCAKLAKLADPPKAPGDVAVGVERLWHESWLTCTGRSLDESSTLKTSNVGADATIALQV